MREHRFRAWHKGYEMMCEVDALFPISGLVNLIMPYYFEKQYFLEDVVIMQFTGEQDYEGRDIWENDVYSDNMGCLYQVKFGKGTFYLSSIPSPLKHKVITHFGNIVSSELKYEGNIFENPELLQINS